jgi:hypothetical protein
MNAKLIITKDIRDESGDTDLFVPAGTVVNFINDEGDYIIAALVDGSVSFPLDPGEYEELLCPQPHK